MPQLRLGDVTIALDALAHTDLAARGALLFDELESWEQRSAAEHHITELLQGIRTHPAVANATAAGRPLIEFAEPRLRLELARLLRGWTLARAATRAGIEPKEPLSATTTAKSLAPICDPAIAPALLIGVRAGLGLDPALAPYVVPPALPGSRLKRALVRPLMRILGELSRPEHVRVAVVAAGKLSLAIASLPTSELRASAIGLMPFPGLDHGNSALLALRRRIPLLPTYDTRHARSAASVQLPERLGLVAQAALDRALTLLVECMLTGVAAELERAVAALAGLQRARSLRAIVLPSAAYGASRLLIEWAHERGVRVGAMQHGIYVFREFDGADRRADLVFGWGAGTEDQARGWPAPRPSIVPVGVPGTTNTQSQPRVRPAQVRVPQIHTPQIHTPQIHTLQVHAPQVRAPRRVLIATTDSLDMPIMPVGFCDAFIDTLAPGLRRLMEAGVQFTLRPHPNEDPQRYGRLLSARRLAVELAPDAPFSSAVAAVDLLVSSASSVAFEAAALGVPVLLWLGFAPGWVRREHLVSPWIGVMPGTFESAEDFDLLAHTLIARPGEAFAVAHELRRRLAAYAEPFDPARFAAGLRELAT
jgi:hypothetical protein